MSGDMYHDHIISKHMDGADENEKIARTEDQSEEGPEWRRVRLVPLNGGAYAARAFGFTAYGDSQKAAVGALAKMLSMYVHLAPWEEQKEQK